MGKKQRLVGLIQDDGINPSEGMKEARAIGYDYTCRRIFGKKKAQELMEAPSSVVTEPFTFCDLDMPSSEWARSFGGILTGLHEELRSSDAKVRAKAVQLVRHELDYCRHLNCPVVLAEPDPKCVAATAEIISSRFLDFSTTGVWARIPLVVKSSDLESSFWKLPQTDSENVSGWYIWAAFQAECRYQKNVFAALEFTEDTPSHEEVLRWLGEPVKCLIIPTDIFMTNEKGYPVLSKAHQQLLREFLKIAYHIIIEPRKGASENLQLYKHYVEYKTKRFDEENQNQAWTEGYDDYLQSPLQPLMHNLESEVYEVFEKDPVKYRLYEDAIAAGIMSKRPDDVKEEEHLVVMIVGAGRGPIVRSAIRAAAKTSRQIKLYALEKNRNAVNTLLHLRRSEWKELDVTVIHSDMRKWKPEVKADIIVSELLGSFGDNELSPECLDGAQNFLKDDGIMIPQSYTSFIQPIMSSKLHTAVNALPEAKKVGSTDWPQYQTPYVVLLRNKFDIAEPVELFNFKHPKRDIDASNDRSKEVQFEVKMDSILSGFAGYFDSELFGGIRMSILPSTYTENMFSWFPIYFPIKNQMPVKAGDVIRLRFRRCSSSRSVWYEWNMTSPSYVATHNLNGNSYEIGL